MTEQTLLLLKSLYDQLAFLKVQELETKREVWCSDPESSIQARDRAASYAATHITTEIIKIEAQIKCALLDKEYEDAHEQNP